MTTRTATLNSTRLPASWARFARPARDGAFIAGIIFAVMIGAGLLPFAVDAHAYWAADPLDPYSDAALSDFDAYFYSPAFTQAIWPLHSLPWPIFAGLWTAAIVLAFTWLSDLWLGLVMLLPPVFIEVAMGNIHGFIAVAIVLGFRWPATWAFVLLTKVTPGVGLLWFVVRREWRSLAIALGATAGIVAVSYAIAPGLWREWIDVLVGGARREHRRDLRRDPARSSGCRSPRCSSSGPRERTGAGSCRSPASSRCRSSGRMHSPSPSPRSRSSLAHHVPTRCRQSRPSAASR